MPSFDTPEPITVTVDLGVGAIEVNASDRPDTVVEVRPSDASKKSDVTAAAQTRVEYANGVLSVKAPKGWRQYTIRGGGESIKVQIDLPAWSRIDADAGIADVRSTGRLGDCHFKTGVGDIQIEHSGALRLKTGAGDISVARAAGEAEVATGAGRVRIGRIDGSAVVKNSNGDTSIGEVTGDLRVSAANGKISVGQAHAAVTAKTANGDVRLDEVRRGVVVAQTALGHVDVGINDQVAAWLDLNTSFGTVRNSMDSAAGPEPGKDTVEVRARTAYGDITIRRSVTTTSGTERPMTA